MSEENHHHGKNEILIIKRHGGGDHDGHHGGAWKIAYADFMTAMMAFFLVMWLVNAANEETKASVATYFNPIKLSDEKPAEKGLEKPIDKADGEKKGEKGDTESEMPTEGSSAATGEDQTAASGEQANYSEADLFENPYSVLAEIAQEVGQQANVSAKGEGGAADSGPSTGAEGGEAYRDPFDPDFWTKQVQNTRGDPGNPDAAPVNPAAGQPVNTGEGVPGQDVAIAVPRDKPAELQDPNKKQDNQAENKDVAALDATQGADAEQQAMQQQAADDLKAAIEREIGGAAGKLSEGLIVTSTEGGLLITITDQDKTPMFDVGSAVPKKELVIAMEKIGKLLEFRPGKIVIRGHTDGRQFKGTQNDNWRLSMSRAHSAYYMLVRGGLGEDRVEQVTGYADRRLAVPEDPLADANRRIEILIQGEQERG
ncbi:MotB family protein [Rhizobium sp. RU36D]|uniref:MotB family protein n=1 Tax=Rhizobium sp. RU36D TaxID=1907415 RepID=UPI0009D89811|nr:MotB family protein [Rhizobium sp. RU36D]SMC84986.1 chemotaxis protein MotB [Rhizobium sp. RU36D]